MNESKDDEPSSEKKETLSKLPFTGFGFRVTLQGAMLSSSVAALRFAMKL